MKLAIHKRGTFRDLLVIDADDEGLAALQEALTSARTGATLHGTPFEVRRAPEGLGEVVVVRVVG